MLGGPLSVMKVWWMPANDKSTQDYFGHAIILSDTHMCNPSRFYMEAHCAQPMAYDMLAEVHGPIMRFACKTDLMTWITCRRQPAARAPKGLSQQSGTLPSTCLWRGDSAAIEGAPFPSTCCVNWALKESSNSNRDWSRNQEDASAQKSGNNPETQYVNFTAEAILYKHPMC